MEIFTASYLIAGATPPLPGGALAVHDGRIAAVGTLAQLQNEYAAPVHDYPGCVIMPGLINAHTHLELTHFPAWKIRKGLDYAPRTYVDWVIQVIKIKRGLSLPELELSLREGFRISLESGVTTVGDILSDLRLLPLYCDSSFNGRLFFELLGHDPGQSAERLKNIEYILDSLSCGNLLPGLSPHAPHTVSSSFFRDIAQLSALRSLPLTVHLAESLEELQFLHDTSGKIAEMLYPFVHWEEYLPHPRRKSPVAFLDELGVFDRPTAAVHCVHLNSADAEILRMRGATVILCPRSNDRLVVGKAPALLLKKAGIPIALGTDSLASNDSLSLWDEMRFLRRQFPGVFTPAEIIGMVTSTAARALQVSDAVGTLEQGKRADFLLMKQPSATSYTDLLEALIEEGQLEEVFIGGRQCSGLQRC